MYIYEGSKINLAPTKYKYKLSNFIQIIWFIGMWYGIVYISRYSCYSNHFKELQITRYLL